MPRFSIILPVKNGGEYLKECVNSILCQTLTDFSLVVLDSGSTDGTVEWVRNLNDSRIHIYPSSSTLSIEQNWARIKEIPKNEWMTIIGHDDLLNPNYLQVITELIDRHPEASMYGSHFNFIDEKGKIIRRSKPVNEILKASDLLEKILVHQIDAVSLMVRSTDYEAIGGFPLFPGLLFADFVYLLELTKISFMVLSPEISLSYRIHTKSTTVVSADEIYFRSYELFIQYLSSLKKKAPGFAEVINKNFEKFLVPKCLEFSKKILKTGKRDRKTFKKVSDLVKRHQEYANLLIDDKFVELRSIPRVRLAIIIDNSLIAIAFFRLISRVF